jgi:predicted nucleic-acid-binding protein
MLAVDSNVLIRYLVQDHTTQSREADEILTKAEKTGERVYLSQVLLAEVFWVLSRRYGFPKAELVRTFDAILHADLFEVESKDCALRALDAFRVGRAGFADYLLTEAAWAAGCERFLTFDRALAGEARGRVAIVPRG